MIENQIFSLEGHSLNRSLDNIFFKISERIYGNNSTNDPKMSHILKIDMFPSPKETTERHLITTYRANATL